MRTLSESILMNLKNKDERKSKLGLLKESIDKDSFRGVTIKPIKISLNSPYIKKLCNFINCSPDEVAECTGYAHKIVMPPKEITMPLDDFVLVKKDGTVLLVKDFTIDWARSVEEQPDKKTAVEYIYSDKGKDESMFFDEENINEAIEQKYDKSNPDYNSFLREVRHYTGSYDYEFGGKVSTECYGQPITVQYFYWNRPYVGGGYNIEVNVLTPMNSMAGDSIQEAIENAFEKNSRVRLSQKEVKQKILDAVANLDKEE